MAKKYKAKYTGKIYDTKQEAINDNINYFRNVGYRYNVKSFNTKSPKNYDIPFIASKKRTLTNAGLATGAVISENMLDSIAKYANAAGLPIKTALGLAVKESTLGNPTDDSSVYKILRPELAEHFKNMGVGQHINNGKSVSFRELINFYVDHDNPYDAALKYAELKSINGNSVDRDKFEKMLIDGERYADSKVKDYERKYANNTVLYNGFKFYKEHPDKYNPGQPNYQQLVNKRANEVWGSPEIQNWYKTYRKRSLEEGGK